MPGRIVIHAGFHKTGTTTVQRFLKENSETLWPLTAIGLRHRFPDLLHSAGVMEAKVLVIDMDHQSSLSIVCLGASNWQKLVTQNRTVTEVLGPSLGRCLRCQVAKL